MQFSLQRITSYAAASSVRGVTIPGQKVPVLGTIGYILRPLVTPECITRSFALGCGPTVVYRRTTAPGYVQDPDKTSKNEKQTSFHLALAMPQLGSILNPNNRTKKWSGVEQIASNTLGEVRFSQRDHCVSFLLLSSATFTLQPWPSRRPPGRT